MEVFADTSIAEVFEIYDTLALSLRWRLKLKFHLMESPSLLAVPVFKISNSLINYLLITFYLS